MVKHKLGMSVLIEISVCGKPVAIATAQRVPYCAFYDEHLWCKFEEHRFFTPFSMTTVLPQRLISINTDIPSLCFTKGDAILQEICLIQ